MSKLTHKDKHYLNQVYGDYRFWSKLTGVIVLDPDGWDRTKSDCMHEKINFSEFVVRCTKSTVANVNRLIEVAGVSNL